MISTKDKRANLALCLLLPANSDWVSASSQLCRRAERKQGGSQEVSKAQRSIDFPVPIVTTLRVSFPEKRKKDVGNVLSSRVS